MNPGCGVVRLPNKMAQDNACGLGPRRASALVQAIAIVWASLFYFTLPVPARAASAEVGGQPAAFLSYGVGGRALAMGGAYYGISDDASAAYWNPSGLAQLQRKEVTTMQATLFAQTKLTYFSFAYPTKGGSTFALSVTQLSSPGFEQVDVTYDPATSEPKTITANGNFQDQEQALAFSWACSLLILWEEPR